MALRDAGLRTPLLFLIFGSAPPVRVAGRGPLEIREAIALDLEATLARTTNHSMTKDEALERIDDVVCWITWSEIAAIVDAQRATLSDLPASVRASIDRLASSVIDAIAWHGPAVTKLE